MIEFEAEKYIWDTKSAYKKPRHISLSSYYHKRYDDRFKWTYIDTHKGRLNMDGFISINDYLFREYGCRINDIVIIDDVKYILVGTCHTGRLEVVLINYITNIKYLKQPKGMKSLVKQRTDIIGEILND